MLSNSGFDINQLNFKANFDYYINTKHSFDFGVSTIRYKLNPGFLIQRVKNLLCNPEEVQTEQALESGIYFTHRYSTQPKISISYRFTIFII